MSKFIGIDYGEKNIGIALSDEGGKIAFPREIFQNNQNLIKSIKEICDTEKVSGIVLGESLAQGGQPNPIQEKIAKFKKILEQKTNLPIYYIPEIWSSIEAGKPLSKYEQLKNYERKTKKKKTNLNIQLNYLNLTINNP